MPLVRAHLDEPPATDGPGRKEALLTAAERRFRPIMMTALTTICGMVPVTLSGHEHRPELHELRVLIGGLATSTLLTLLVVPVFYTFFDDAQLAVGRTLRHALGRPRAERAEA